LISELQTNEQHLERIATTAVPFTLTPEFPVDAPYSLSWIRSTWTSGPAILIPSCNVRDENNNIVVVVGLIPWQFANTTIERVNVQSPEVNQTNLFGPAISGWIASGLTVFPGWSLQFTDFLAGAVTFSADVGFTRVTDNG
jgi:hypothetical protein